MSTPNLILKKVLTSCVLREKGVHNDTCFGYVVYLLDISVVKLRKSVIL